VEGLAPSVGAHLPVGWRATILRDLRAFEEIDIACELFFVEIAKSWAYRSRAMIGR
jgi:hypothetical protein